VRLSRRRRLGEEPTPSFVLMDVTANRAVVYVYELKTVTKDGETKQEVKVQKIEHSKVEAPTQSI